MLSNLPMFLTWLRIILIPLLVAIFYLPGTWLQPIGRDLAATVIFIVAAATDWLDGYLSVNPEMPPESRSVGNEA